MNLDTLGPPLLGRLEAKNRQREAVLGTCRPLVQFAARTIRAIHRGEWEAADVLLAEAKAVLERMNASAAGHADLAAAGYLLDAQKEYAEAHLVYALVRGDAALPGPEALGIEDAAWLHGLGEAAGELRRAALDAIRRSEVAAAEQHLAQMDDIYAFLSTIDYPAAITRDLKRTNDMVRGVVERTRGDLTVAMRQEALQAALERIEGRVG